MDVTDAAVLARMYPSSAEGQAAQAAQAAPQAAAAPAEPKAPAQPSQPVQQPAQRPTDEEMGTRLYGDAVETRTQVNFLEPAASSADDLARVMEFPDGQAVAPEQRDQIARFATGLKEAGAGPSFAREVWADALAAERGGSRIYSEVDCVAELRRAWGAAFDRKLATARQAIATVAQRSPEVIGFLNRTGLGNNPAFIRKIAARVAKMPPR